MKRIGSVALLVAVVFAAAAAPAFASGLDISIQPAAGNPAQPRMGDRLTFHTVIRNADAKPVEGLIAWISLVEVDKGNEQPVDLEDWSAGRAITAGALPPAGIIQTDWPIRLIKAGDYRVVVSAATQKGTGLATSPFADFTVRQKPVVDSGRLLPVIIFVPGILAAAMFWRIWRTRAAGRKESLPAS